ncbi:hypothetical protein [Bradyrhizobium diazoefficiens]
MNKTMLADDPEHGPSALRQLRAMTVDICDVIALTDENDFHITTTTVMAGNALLVDVLAPLTSNTTGRLRTSHAAASTTIR